MSGETQRNIHDFIEIYNSFKVEDKGRRANVVLAFCLYAATVELKKVVSELRKLNEKET